jgi:undecaprenyl diphosphate synthase
MASAEQLIKEKLPKHIAIIMDGNGRWARKRSLNRITGHQKGMESVRETVKNCRELGIQVLTLYAFSIENWNRPKTEINALMRLLKRYVRSEINDLHKNNIRIQSIGNLESLPADVQKVVIEAINKTKNNGGMILNIALSYGGRDEILHAVAKLVQKAINNGFDPATLSEETFSRELYTAGLPDPDLLIRTSGEMRISNFLLWQMAYTEIYVTDVLWPDFRKDDLYQALLDYQKRQRRFGLTGEQISKQSYYQHG